MGYYQIILLAVIQGLTEFLPISSSGHLILAPKIFAFDDQGLALDAILHLGTLLAIIIFFRKDLSNLLVSLFDRKADLKTRRLAIHILYASIPAGIIGLFWGEAIENNLRDSNFVAINLLIWSVVFYVADRQAKKRSSGESEEDVRQLNLGKVLFVGVAQAVALLPGTSRSGITIAAGLFTGLAQTTAARFSFLLGAPIILAAGLHKLGSFLTASEGSYGYSLSQLGVGFFISFAVGYVAIRLLLGIVARVGLTPFIIYRIVLSFAVLAFNSI